MVDESFLYLIFFQKISKLKKRWHFFPFLTEWINELNFQFFLKHFSNKFWNSKRFDIFFQYFYLRGWTNERMGEYIFLWNTFNSYWNNKKKINLHIFCINEWINHHLKKLMNQYQIKYFFWNCLIFPYFFVKQFF